MTFTDRDFWDHFWSKYIPRKVNDAFFTGLERYFPKGGSLIEVGGFPGEYLAFFRKWKNYEVTLLDYYIKPDVVRSMEKINDLKEGTIRLVEADFLEYQSDRLYDMVFSQGFIEHFEDPKDMIRRHIELLSPGGMLFISIPNFTGINGWFQKHLDPKNYLAHNISCMNPILLKKWGVNLD